MYKILANTLFMGKKLVFVPECHSTNSLALELSQKEDLPEGTIVIADNQMQGRGQRGNTWVTEPGKNLTFSIIVKPTFLTIKDQFLLNMVVSLAIRDFVQEKLQKKVSVKWPNDVIVDDFKLCGILIENQIQGAAFSNSIIGIGLNINQRAFYLKNASSLSILTHRTYNLQTMLEEVVAQFEIWYLILRQQGIDRIKKAYLTSLYGVNEINSFKAGADQFEGMIEGVDDTGRLMIKTEVGTRYFNLKEVQFDFEPFK